MAKFDRGQRMVLGLGAAMIGAGALFFILQIVGEKHIGTWVPLLVGIICMILALITRFPSFILMACLLITGGAGLAWYTVSGASADGAAIGDGAEVIFLLMISAGFLAASGLSRFLSEKTLIWPLFPGVAGVIVGVMLLI